MFENELKMVCDRVLMVGIGSGGRTNSVHRVSPLVTGCEPAINKLAMLGLPVSLTELDISNKFEKERHSTFLLAITSPTVYTVTDYKAYDVQLTHFSTLIRTRSSFYACYLSANSYRDSYTAHIEIQLIRRILVRC